jgi:autotransporter translocation and assembly factor TamB
VLVVLLVLVYLLRGPLLSKPLGVFVGDRLSEALDGRFEVDAVSGSWFGDVELLGVRTLESPKMGALRRIDARSLRVGYSLFTLLGERPLDAIEVVEAEELEVELDLLAPTEPSEEPLDLQAIVDLLPEEIPRLDVDAKLSVITADGVISIDRLTIKGGGERVTVGFAGVALPATWELPGANDFELALVRVDRGTVRVEGEDGVMGVEIRGVEASHLGGDTWTLEADLSLFGAPVAVTATPESADVGIEGLDLASIPSWVRRAVVFEEDWPAAGMLTAKAVVREWAGESPSVSLDAALTGVTWPDHGTAQASVLATWHDGRIVVQELKASTDGATVDGTGVVVDPELPLVIVAVERLHWTVEDVRATLARLGMATEDVPWPDVPVSLSGRIAGRPEAVTLEAFRVEAGDAEVSGSGTLGLPSDPESWRGTTVALTFRARVPDVAPLLHPDLDLGQTSGSVSIDGSVTGTVTTPEADLQVAARDLVVRGERIGGVDGEASLAWPVVHARRFRVEGDVGTIDARGKVDIEAQTVVDAAFDVRVADLGRIDRIMDLPAPLSGSVSVEATGSKTAGGWTEGYAGSVDVRGSALTYDGHALGEATVTAEVAWPDARITALTVRGPTAGLDVEGTVSWSELPGFDLPVIRLQVPDLLALREALGAVVPDLPPMAGSLELNLAARKASGEPWEAMQGEGTASLRSLVVDGTVLGDVDATVSGDGARRFSIPRLHGEGPWGSADLALEATLTVHGGAAEIVSLEGTMEGLAFRLLEPMRPTWTSAGTVDVPALALEVLGGTVRGAAQVGDSVDITLEGRNLALGSLPGETGVEGTLSLSIALTGTAARPDVTLRLEVPDLRYRGEAGSLMVRGAQGEEGVRVESLELRVGPGTTVTAEGLFPIAAGTDGVTVGAWDAGTARLDGEFRDLELLRRFGLPAEVEFADAALEVSLREGVVEAEGRINAPRAGSDLPAFDLAPTVTLGARIDAASTRVRVAATGGRDLSVTGDATVNAGFDSDAPDRYLDALLDGSLTATLDAEVPDLSRFLSLVPGIVRLRGRLLAKGEATGTLRAPQVRGRVDGTDLEVKPEGDVPGLTDGVLAITADWPKVHIEGLRGQLGYSPVSVTGDVVLSGDPGKPHQLDLVLQGKNALLARSRYLRLRSDLDVSVKGPLDSLLVAGSVTVTDALISEPMNLTASSTPTAPQNGFQLFSQRDPPLSTARFDVRILADRSIRIVNNLLNGDVSADFVLRGTGELPQPDGRLYFPGMRVQLPFSRLHVRRGDIVLDQDAPFSPQIAVSAETRMRGYDMIVQVQGTLQDPQVNITSDPYLPHQDALALLTLGATPSGLQEEGLSRAALTRLGSLMGESILGSILGPSDPDKKGIGDRVNVEVGRDVSESGQSTIEFEYQMFDSLYLRAERDRYDDYNIGLIWRWRFR